LRYRYSVINPVGMGRCRRRAAPSRGERNTGGHADIVSLRYIRERDSACLILFVDHTIYSIKSAGTNRSMRQGIQFIIKHWMLMICDKATLC
jgi:hypothetical protein